MGGILASHILLPKNKLSNMGEYMETQVLDIIYALKAVTDNEFSKSHINSTMKTLDQLTNFMLRQNITEIPTNLSELFKLLYNRPANMYFKGIESDEPFILNNGEMNKMIEQEMGEDNVEEEMQRRTMREFLYKCRRKKIEDESEEWDEIYKLGRRFVSEHYLIERVKLDQVLINTFPNEVATFIKDMYTQERQITTDYFACPVCGKPVEVKEDKTFTCMNPVCNYYIEEERLKVVKKEVKNKLVKLHPGIYRYVLTPSIAELRLYYKLCERFKTCEVKLYPNIDEYDLSVANSRGTVLIDVKDTARPAKLVNLLKEESNIEKLIKSPDETRYLVIPDHRVKLYRMNENMRYIQELRNLLENEAIRIDVIQERYLMTKIEEVLKL